jgi:hypothetical protein
MALTQRLMMPDIVPNEIAQQIAEHILLSSIEDVEWLTIGEMTSDYFEYGEGKSFEHIYKVDESAVWDQVDYWLRKSKVTITFED